MREVNVGQDQSLLNEALIRLDGLMIAVRRAADLRGNLLTMRQKRLFQARPTLESATNTLMAELARGEAEDSGVGSVRDVAVPWHRPISMTRRSRRLIAIALR